VSTWASEGMMEDMLWIPGAADLVEHVNQCVLAVRLERNIEVDRGARGRVAHALPVLRDDIPRVLDMHVSPTW